MRPAIKLILSLSSLAFLAGMPMLMGGCGGSAEASVKAEPQYPPHVGNWFQDGRPSGNSIYLQLMPNGEFLYRRVMASHIKGPTHRGQYRFDDDGNIGLYKYLSQGGLSAAPLTFLRYDGRYIIPIDKDTKEVSGRHFVHRETLPITIINEENVPDSVLAEASRRASGKD